MDDRDIAALYSAASGGDEQAWARLVDRFMPLVLSIARRFQLSGADTEDVSQTVWLRLVNNLGSIREPRALAGWISTTTRHEVLAVLHQRHRTDPVDPGATWILQLRFDSGQVDEDVLRDERRRALRAGLAELTPRQQQLLVLLANDPPLSYEEISHRTGMPVGSIGPTRARCLQKLRQTSPVRSLVEADGDPVMGGGNG